MTIMLGPGLLDGLFRQKIFIRGIGELYQKDGAGKGITYHDAGTWQQGDLLVAVMGYDRVRNPADWADYHPSNICNMEIRYATSNSTDATPDIEDSVSLLSYSSGVSSIGYCQVIALASLDPSKQVYLNLQGTHIRESSDIDWLYGSIGAGPDAEETMVLHFYHRHGYNWRTTNPNGWGAMSMTDHPEGTNIFTSMTYWKDPKEYWNGYDWSYEWAGLNYEYQDVSAAVSGGNLTTPSPVRHLDFYHNNDTKSFRFGLRTPP